MSTSATSTPVTIRCRDRGFTVTSLEPHSSWPTSRSPPVHVLPPRIGYRCGMGEWRMHALSIHEVRDMFGADEQLAARLRAIASEAFRVPPIFSASWRWDEVEFVG